MNIRARNGRVQRGRRPGAALVEFAVIAPLLFMVILGLFFFGRALMVQEILTNAAREGARFMTLPGATDQQMKTGTTNWPGGVEGFLQAASVDPSLVSYGGTPTVTASEVTVTITVPFDQVSWVPTPDWLTGAMTITGSAKMKLEPTN